jgi:hypothetical protein
MPSTPTDLLTLARLDLESLERLFAEGHPVELARLAGFEFYGMNLGVPAFFARSFRKFRKVFCRHAESGRYGGWNLRTRQNGDSEPWLDAPPAERGAETAVAWLTGRRTSSAAHGFFALRSAGLGERARPGALVIDYGSVAHPLMDVTALLRDVAVCVSEGDHDLLVGRAYLQLGPALVRAPGIFALSRAEPIRDPGPSTRPW